MPFTEFGRVAYHRRSTATRVYLDDGSEYYESRKPSSSTMSLDVCMVFGGRDGARRWSSHCRYVVSEDSFFKKSQSFASIPAFFQIFGGRFELEQHWRREWEISSSL